MGGGSRFLMYKEEDKALEALNRAFDLGITYMDTAFGYGNGLSEERVGKVHEEPAQGDLPGHEDQQAQGRRGHEASSRAA